MNKHVVTGLSGGVDSSVSARLLLDKGYTVTGVTIITSDADPSAIDDARRCAASLGIKHLTVDCREVFERDVIQHFMNEYLDGRTPNPCVVCNRKVKWRALIDAADSTGADYVATGHYCSIKELPSGRFAVTKASDLSKDQSYVLYGLPQEYLKRTLMPLGGLTKEKVREIAAGYGIPSAQKPDSQEICFIPDGDYAGYIERHSKRPIPGEGDFIDGDGNILGRHKGIIHYTIGQRKGLGISAGHPVFVEKILPDTDQVVISHEDVYSDTLVFSQVNFMGIASFEESSELTAKIRYAHRGERCRVDHLGQDKYICRFMQPVRAVTPGQAVVFYTGDAVAAGGIIE